MRFLTAPVVIGHDLPHRAEDFGIGLAKGPAPRAQDRLGARSCSLLVRHRPVCAATNCFHVVFVEAVPPAKMRKIAPLPVAGLIR